MLYIVYIMCLNLITKYTKNCFFTLFLLLLLQYLQFSCINFFIKIKFILKKKSIFIFYYHYDY